MVTVNTLDSQTESFDDRFDDLLMQKDLVDEQIVSDVESIIHAVRRQGDAAVLDYTKRFDRLQLTAVSELELSLARLQTAYTAIAEQEREALHIAADRIQSYAEKQKLESWTETDEYGNLIGQKVHAIERAGLYVPGGKAAYPSSVLMNAVPAKVAGVAELIMVVPAPNGVLNEKVLAAAKIAGVDRVFTIGGAQAIAALAYGTESIPRVDKIVGPGNIYVATAKRKVFGAVGIDMVAGPSEIVIVSDGQSNPDWIAMDMFSQAEHDEDAQAILISPDQDFLSAVASSIQKLLPGMQRKSIIEKSLQRRGAFIKVSDLAEAISLVNRIAPEHLELSLQDAAVWAEQVRHAGAIFLGAYTAEVLGDYCAGPNHVLPTSGTARFASPLGVYDFQKRSSVIQCSPEGGSSLGRTAAVLAHAEGLEAHARAAEYRVRK